MHKIALLLVVVSSTAAFARDSKYTLAIADVLAMPEAQGRLDANIKMSFGAQKGPAGQTLGEVVVNPKTNATNKDDATACKWVMLSALVDLQAKARSMGANAIVGIESYYKKVSFVSETQYECHAGAIMAGVALRGQMVKTK
jgi:hypothetical protein